MRGRLVSMEEFVRALAPHLDRPIPDRTNYQERFDFRLDWAPDSTTPGDDSRPSIFSALQQLGLKLEPQKAPVDVLVVDHVGKPSAN